MNAGLQLSPLLPDAPYIVMGVAAVIVAAIAFWKKIPDFYARALFFIVVSALLLNPVVVHEVRQPLPNKLVIITDKSPSQNIGGRNAVAEKALQHIKDALKTMPQIEPVIVEGGMDAASLKDQNTSLFAPLKDTLSSLPSGQIAGTVLITDGQVHDVPENMRGIEKAAPFHVILTGKKDEFDRRITIVNAPKYGMLSQQVTIRLRIDDTGRTGGVAALDIRQDGKSMGQMTLNAGEEKDFTFTLDHPGQNIFEFSVPAEKDELTDINNTAAVIINGVRDRLHVLLVSGMPHVGERAWRDLLKSDPSIDLVHFTILRSPSSLDNTPSRELALIAFPVEELFEHKIREFDLIIFDKYVSYGLLQPQYFANIASYVKEGGAFLMAMGSDEPEESIFDTAVGDILPITPKLEEETILKGTYAPQLTDTGKTHPVTADLQPEEKSKSPWGAWMTQADVTKTRGETLMTGINNAPLLILDHVGDGRVGVLTSDNIWLWSKGVNGSGPYTELLRHLAHWLMKEPELEEDYIKAEARGNTITVAMRDLTQVDHNVTLTRPGGTTETVTLAVPQQGWISARVTAEQNGIYKFTHGDKTAYAVIGTAHSEEFSDVHTTDQKLAPIVSASKGSTIWFNDTPAFQLKPVKPGAGRFGGNDWIGLKENDAYRVMNIESAPLMPDWLSILIILAGLIAMWWRESGKNFSK